MAATGFDQAVEQGHRAVVELLRGNPEPQKQMFSHRDDVSLANPFGLVMHGWDQVAQTLERVATQMRDGDVTFENIVTCVTSELAFIVEVERSRARIGSSGDIAPFALRVTTILRPEDGGWKIVHRHADPLTTARPMESVVG